MTEPSPRPGRHLSRLALVAVVLTAATPRVGAAQSQPRLDIQREDGSTSRVSVLIDRGYAAVPISVLSDLGWTVIAEGSGVTISAAGEMAVSLQVGSPFFRWDGLVLQFTDAPYRAGSNLFVPLQLLTDFLPRRLPGLYDYSGDRSLLRAGDISLIGEELDRLDELRPTAGGSEPLSPVSSGGGMEDGPMSADEVREAGPSPYDGVRVVVIDPGHGGVDPGALGPDGIREKNVALEVGLRVAEVLRRNPDLEVHLIRDDDTFVDVWERGLIATDIKGERPGIFVSIHANSFPARREARGFETYFLSDARTEHERRVSAIENASITMNPQNVDEESVADIDFILRDLKNYEHAHWSEDLASLVQDELDDVHPGPNRGVKQGVLAVLTNALMPSVLVELGYLSNSTEGRLMGTGGFHRDAAAAIADAVERFFERYPPGNGLGSDREER
ncbi:MAG: N-acetylmuramoyl-L-alanine amidase [Gemmatimonadetes bacterium]|nr:N-acetylmuramoyl-L-alanine amidase [Gemmatimonadota bacterium]NNF12671.1 N-acetylmuramoyl-L-alanine amidase [Gemmatimonadota bacterium]NNL29472.1 N-acetylmuramoyl-L-alanine amidase [Gemmatimonadota bacterium]